MRASFLVLVLTGIALSSAGTLRILNSQEPATSSSPTNPFMGLSEPTAKLKFQQASLSLRRQHRAALQNASTEWQAHLAATQAADEPLRMLVDYLERATDLTTAVEHIVQLREQFTPDRRVELDRTVSLLATHLTSYRALRKDYQAYVGSKLAERWLTISLNDKRQRMREYYGLVDESPAWLLRMPPLSLMDLVPKSALQPLQRYESEKRDLLSAANAKLTKRTEALTEALRGATEEVRRSRSPSSSAQQVSLQELYQLLSASYRPGIQGLMLLQEDPALPAKVTVPLRALRAAFIEQLSELENAHKKLVEELRIRMRPGQLERLSKLNLEEQMMIDLTVDQKTQLWRPLRMFAQRFAASLTYEDAQLLGVRSAGAAWEYKIEYLIDGASAWLSADRVLLKPTTDKLYPRMQRAIPEDGPGEPVTLTTNLANGDVSCHSARGWMPAIVLDESPFGVVLRWHGAAEFTEILEPRHHLRIVTRP